MKKLLILILSAVLLTGIFAGCGTQKTGTESSQASQQSTAAGGKIDNTEVKEEQKPVQITFMHWRGEDKAAYAKIYEKFKQIEPNISISEEILPSGDYMTVLQTRLSGGAASDIFGINDVVSAGSKFNDAGYLEPLNDIKELDQVQEVFKKVGTDATGKIFAAVWNDVNFGLFYNQDIFTQAGVEKPKTWKEFLDVCQKFKDKGITPISVGGKDSFTLYWLECYIAANDQYVKDPEAFAKVNQRKAKFSELDAFRSTLDKFETLAKKGYITKECLGLGYSDSVTLFSQGKAAMLAGGAFTAPTILGANPDIKMGAMAIPGEKGENNTFGVPGMAYGINKATSDDAKKAAKKFLSFMFDKEVSRQFSEETTLFTTLKGVEMKFHDPASTDFANMAGSMVLITALDPKVVDTNYNTQLWSDMQGLIAGKTNVDQMIKNQDSMILK